MIYFVWPVRRFSVYSDMANQQQSRIYLACAEGSDVAANGLEIGVGDGPEEAMKLKIRLPGRNKNSRAHVYIHMYVYIYISIYIYIDL